MHPSVYVRYAQVQRRHWWFRHRRAIVARLLARHVPRRDGDDAVALDLGCATGGETDLLRAHARTVVGYERSFAALTQARDRHPGAAWVCADVNRLGATLAPESADLALLLNVLYHREVRDDGKVLEALHGVLRPGGLVVVTEAAYASLRRRRDRLDHGARRYRRSGLVALLREAGFRPLGASYFNALPLPAAWLRARLEARGTHDPEGGETGLEIPAAPWNGLLYALLGLERLWLATGLPLPAGVNLVAAGRK